MFRRALRKLSLRQKLLMLAAVGVLLPLLVLTYLQYRSLIELQTKTKGAFKDNVRQGMTLVQNRMKQRLAGVAFQTLEPINTMHASSPLRDQELEKYFAQVKRAHPEVQEIFVFDYSTEQGRRSSIAYEYSDSFVKVEQTKFTIYQSRIQALFDREDKGAVDDNHKFAFVYDASYPGFISPRVGTYLFCPLTDSKTSDGSPVGVVRGFAGVLLSERFVNEELIGGVLKALIASHSPKFAVTISDEQKRVLYSNGAPQNGYLLEANLDSPFSSWKAAVGLMDTDVEALARDSFLHSAGATLLVLVFLLGGIALTLRATDREARLAQAKSNFVSNVSHELKTPLSLISLFSEILELGRVDNEEKKKEYYGIIRHESQRLNKTIDNILDFSKIEAGRKKYELVDGDMAQVIDNVLSTHRYQFINSGVDVQTDVQRDLPPVLMDRDAMAQAISNLIDNAIKYSADMKQLSITAKKVDSNLSVEITDRGIGISRAEQQKVFEKFYRVGNGLVHDVKGSGLGLSLVKHIVEAHNGTISVESEIEKGSRFTILIPLASGIKND